MLSSMVFFFPFDNDGMGVPLIKSRMRKSSHDVVNLTSSGPPKAGKVFLRTSVESVGVFAERSLVIFQ